MERQRLQLGMETAIIAVLAYLIGLIPLQIGPSFSINIGAVAIFILAFRRGAKPAIMAGALWGLISIVLGTASMLTPFQVFLEYAFAFSFMGIAGFWEKAVKRELSKPAGGKRRAFWLFSGATFAAMFCEYFIHFIAGIFFWSQFAPEGMNAVMYSLVMNTLSGVATWIASALVAWLVIQASPRLINPKK